MSYRWLGADLSSLRENAVLAGEVRPRSDQEAAPAGGSNGETRRRRVKSFGVV